MPDVQLVQIDNETTIWAQVSGAGDPVLQIHGAGFAHYNFGPITPLLAREFMVIDYDQRGFGGSSRPDSGYSLEGWADDAAKLLNSLGISRVHVHGTSMGGMVAQVFAAKYPQLTQSLVLNCTAAKIGRYGRLVFKNWIDIARLDPEGPGSRILAELMAWEAVSPSFLDGPDGEATVDRIHEIMSSSNSLAPFISSCTAMIEMDLRARAKSIEAPTLVIGGDLDMMTPWDQGSTGAGQRWVVDNIRRAECHMISGSGHSTIFDNTREHCAVVSAFLRAHSIDAHGAPR